MARGFLLHSRPYRETSLLATFMTDTDGRMDLIVRSVRGKKSQPLLPFCLYEMVWVGKGNLKSLQSCEQLAAAPAITGKNLFCAFYINEIIYRLLPQNQPDYVLLGSYSRAIERLTQEGAAEPVLREFEMDLLDVLGYGLDLRSDRAGGALKAGVCYLFEPEAGLTPAEPDSLSWKKADGRIIGKACEFLAIADRDFSASDVRHLAKSVLRTSLAIYLGGRPLKSRELFR